LLVVQLQQVVGYSPIQAGVASLPITALMLALSARSGALAQRIGPRLQLTIGPLLTTRPGQRAPTVTPGPRLTLAPGVQSATLAPITLTHTS